ncbi:MAG TPA: type II toxin-antitoxin system VapC family toxin [bacterium]|nr:type II toxin-antitoxin system VapC family toxin [bacterium]HPN45207.1 type II toxin-antitoxin system VapC family toxin [bacterium]
MKYLIDTNILIYLMNSKSVKLQEKFTTKSPDDFCVSVITVAELIYGAKKSKNIEKNLNAVIKILSPFTIIDFSSEDAFAYGDIRAGLERNGQIIGANDLLIASQALSRNLIVVTANTGEFARVGGLTIENWV